MINIFSKYKIIFYLINFFLIILYVYPGSIFGLIIYNNLKIQPQITPDFIVSSNHFYVFVALSIVAFLSFIKTKEIKPLIVYLVFLSIFLELFHLIIPERTFQWSDLFGNLLGVIVVIFINNLIKKYGVFKK